MTEPKFYLMDNELKWFWGEQKWVPTKETAHKFTQEDANNFKEENNDYDWITIPVMPAAGIESFKTLKPQMAEKEQVNSPDHYTAGGLEVIDILRKKLTAEEFQGFCKGNVIKYTMRAGLKDEELIDVMKAQYYNNQLLKFHTTDEAT